MLTKVTAKVSKNSVQFSLLNSVKLECQYEWVAKMKNCIFLSLTVAENWNLRRREKLTVTLKFHLYAKNALLEFAFVAFYICYAAHTLSFPK